MDPAFRTPAFRVAESSIASDTIASARCRLARTQLCTAHEAIAFEPAPFGSHCICPSSQIIGFTIIRSESFLARCRGYASIFVVLATFGVVCHAQMTPQDASGVTSCEAELASCQAVLGAVGTRKAEDVVPLAAVTAETGTPSSASEGARLRSSPRFAWHAQTAWTPGRCTCTRGPPVPCRATCARRQEHERRGAASRHRAASRVERNQLRSPAAGLSSAKHSAHGCDQPG